MDSVNRFAQAKKRLCREIMAATSPFDLAHSLWSVAALEPANTRFSEFSGMMPVLAVFETIPDGKLYYKQLDPNTAIEWIHQFGERDWMGADDVEVSLA